MFLMPYIYFLIFAVGPKQCLSTKNSLSHFIFISEEGVDVEDGANASNAR